jgi:hypothetical protein
MNFFIVNHFNPTGVKNLKNKSFQPHRGQKPEKQIISTPPGSKT